MYRHAVARDGTSWALPGAILGAALGLRVLGLDRKSVWFDEAVTHLDAHVPWSQLLDAIRSDVHPPLNYVVFHLWPLIDAGDFWLRLPAAVLGALAAVVAWAWARQIGTPVQAFITAAFVALAPLQIDLAQEARMYGLLLLLTATSLWLFNHVLAAGSGKRAGGPLARSDDDAGALAQPVRSGGLAGPSPADHVLSTDGADVPPRQEPRELNPLSALPERAVPNETAVSSSPSRPATTDDPAACSPGHVVQADDPASSTPGGLAPADESVGGSAGQGALHQHPSGDSAANAHAQPEPPRESAAAQTVHTEHLAEHPLTRHAQPLLPDSLVGHPRPQSEPTTEPAGASHRQPLPAQQPAGGQGGRGAVNHAGADPLRPGPQRAPGPHRAAERPRLAVWLAYALVASLMLYTHYYAALLLAAEAAAAVLALRTSYGRGARWALGALGGAGLSFVPWLPVLAEQAHNIQGDYWLEAPRWTTLWVTFRELAAHTPPDEQFRTSLRVTFVAHAGLLVLGAAWAIRDARQRVAVLLGVVPLGLALGLSVLVAPVFAVRYVSPIGLAFAFLLARGITSLPRIPAVIAAGVAVSPLLLSLGPLYSDPGYGRADLRTAARSVQATRRADEVVLHLGAFTAAPFDYYGVAQPGLVLETNQRSELCDVLRAPSAGWLITAYTPNDDTARADAEAGITSPAYAGDLIREPPQRFLGVSVFHLTARC
jgi:hypothetical protein